MSNLTEQWEKGELPLGMYYVKTPLGVEIHSDYSLYRYKLTRDVDSIEVLAPVPSYEEWQELINKKYWCNARAKNLLEKNQQLKEMLKECKETIETSVWGNCSALTDQIDEVMEKSNGGIRKYR